MSVSLCGCMYKSTMLVEARRRYWILQTRITNDNDLTSKGAKSQIIIHLGPSFAKIAEPSQNPRTEIFNLVMIASRTSIVWPCRFSSFKLLLKNKFFCMVVFFVFHA